MSVSMMHHTNLYGGRTYISLNDLEAEEMGINAQSRQWLGGLDCLHEVAAWESLLKDNASKASDLVEVGFRALPS